MTIINRLNYRPFPEDPHNDKISAESATTMT